MTASPDAFIEISVPLGGDVDDALRDLFERHGGGAIEETRWCGPEDGADLPVPERWLRAYVPVGDVESRLRIELGLWRLSRLGPVPESSVRRLARANWAEAWKAHYRPLRIGTRFLVTPTWIAPEPSATDLVIRLDPGMAFGTGLHPTTQLCLAALEAVVRPGARVLDVGTGTGILAIGAALLGATEVTAIDVAPHAVAIATANAATNGVAIAASVGEVTDVTGTFDVVAANLLAVTLRESAAALASVVRPEGALVASGVLLDQVDDVATDLRRAGLLVTETTTSGDWAAMLTRRLGAGWTLR